MEGRSQENRGEGTRVKKKAEAERSIRRSREGWSQLRSTPAARRPVARAVVVGSIPTSSARGARLKTSLVQGSWRRYSCNRSSRGHIGTQAPPDVGDVFLFVTGGQQGEQVWRATGGGRGTEPRGAVEERHAHVYAGDTQ